MSPHCDLDLEDSNNNNKICMTIQLMMLHHHTKFGNKMFCESENIIQTFMNMLNLHCDLDLECSYPTFSTKHSLMMLYYEIKYGCKWTSSLGDTTAVVIF